MADVFHYLLKTNSVHKLLNLTSKIWKWIIKHKVLTAVFLSLVLIIFVVGFFTGSWRAKRTMNKFPEIGVGTRLLIVSPHPDDEILVAGGLIQKVLKANGEVKVIFLTSGDASRETIYRTDVNPSYSQSEFLDLGKMRMEEALNADTAVGVAKENIVFLGFPDGGLDDVYFKHFASSDGVFASQTTGSNNVPYDGVYKKGTQYLGKFIVQDVQEITDDFKPNIVATTDFKDTHTDHKTAYYIVQRVKEILGANWPIYTSVIHFKGYPNKGSSLVPPAKIYSNNWYTLELTEEERNIKMTALLKYSSQYKNPVDRSLFDILDARNEIFQKE